MKLQRMKDICKFDKPIQLIEKMVSLDHDEESPPFLGCRVMDLNLLTIAPQPVHNCVNKRDILEYLQIRNTRLYL